MGFRLGESRNLRPACVKPQLAFHTSFVGARVFDLVCPARAEGGGEGGMIGVRSRYSTRQRVK